MKKTVTCSAERWIAVFFFVFVFFSCSVGASTTSTANSSVIHQLSRRVLAASSTGKTKTPAPFLVGLRKTQDGPSFCEGTLISSRHVLTAAHCAKEAKWSFGTETIRIAEDQTALHPRFQKPFKTSFDAAILELEFASTGTPIGLDNSPVLEDNLMAKAYVYDSLVVNDSGPDEVEVKTIDLPIWSKERCAKMPQTDHSMLCAGGKKDQDTCFGNSGGPLVITDKDGQSFVAGIVSGGYGRKCGMKNVPGIYVRVAEIASFVDARVPLDHRWRFDQCNNKNCTVGKVAGVAEGPVTSNGNRPNVAAVTSDSSEEYKSSLQASNDSADDGSSTEEFRITPIESYTVPATLPLNVRKGVTDLVFREQDEKWMNMFPPGMWDAVHDPERRMVFFSSQSLADFQQQVEEFERRAIESGRATRKRRFPGTWEKTHLANACS